MRLTRLVSSVLALVVTAVLVVSVSSTAQAVTRPVPINGVAHKGAFYIRGVVGLDLAKKKISVERQDRPGTKWHKWKKVYVNKKGIYRIQISRLPGSKATCYRVSIRALNGFEKSRSVPKCIVQVR